MWILVLQYHYVSEQNEVIEMSEKDMLQIFANNLTYFLSLNNATQADLAKAIGSSTSAVSDWCNARKMPRMDKVEETANWLGINITDLIRERTEKQGSNYYLSAETREIADVISKDDDLKLLFSAARKVSSDDLKAVHQLLKSLKTKEDGEN